MRALRDRLLKEFWQVKPEKSRLSNELNEPVDKEPQSKPDFCCEVQLLLVLEGLEKHFASPQPPCYMLISCWRRYILYEQLTVAAAC